MIDFKNLNIKGLTKEEVLEREENNKVNKAKSKINISHTRIILSSFFTFSNCVLYIVALGLIITILLLDDGLEAIPITKFGFLLIILFNASISIYSKEKSKRTLEKLKVLSSKNVRVIREGEEVTISEDNIVLDDYLINDRENNNTFVDSKIIEGEAFFNEAILSGEEKPVLKKKGDIILGGSILLEGEVISQAIEVGETTFIKKLERKVKDTKKAKSKLNKDINKIILVMVYLVIPGALTVFISTFISDNFSLTVNQVKNLSTVIVGMIPIGLVLLSSITLANSIIKLSHNSVSVEELYAIETLARVDTLAFDKTGTLTKKEMKVKSLNFNKDISALEIKEYRKLLLFYLNQFNDNDTSKALKKLLEEEFEGEKIEYSYKLGEKVYFSSKNKFSSLEIDNDLYSLGVTEVVCDNLSQEEEKQIEDFTKKGYRVVSFSKNHELIMFAVLENELRDNIKDTISYFNDLNVEIKVISGDDLYTCQEIASRCGIINYEKGISLENVSLEELDTLVLDYTIFSRATPEHKERIIELLQNKYNKKVAYVGDGVNDITSLRKASSSIALKSGVESSKTISDFTLLDDDFSHLIEVIKEGRRVISNISRTCVLFITKDILIFTFSLFSLLSKDGLMIGIESIYIYEFVISAFCGFLLSIENNIPERNDEEMVKPSLIKGGLLGFSLALPGVIFMLLSYGIEDLRVGILSSISITILGVIVLFLTTTPFTKYSKRVFIIGASLSIFFAIFAPDVFFDPTFLLGLDSIFEQVREIFVNLFNFEFYATLSLIDYVVLIVTCLLVSLYMIFTWKFLRKRNFVPKRKY